MGVPVQSSPSRTSLNMSRAGWGVPYSVRLKLNKFQHVVGGQGPVQEGRVGALYREAGSCAGIHLNRQTNGHD